MAGISEITGSIFDSECQVIVNTVNCKGVMGKGLALEFKYRYPEMYKDYKKKCNEGKIKTGELTLWKESKPWILNFPTKNDWKYPSRLEYIEKGLDFFVENYKKLEIESVAFPKLGAHNGGLPWSIVKNKIIEKLSNLDIKIELYTFDPELPDKLFEKLIKKLSDKHTDYSRDVGIKSSETTIIKHLIEDGTLKSFYDLQKTEGIGKKTLQKLYSFVQTSKKNVQTTLLNK